MNSKPELLAPAGGWEAMVAAVQNGADAVYLGGAGFNARQSADNFAGDCLREAVEYCHLRGVRVHVTLNTMVRDGELSELEQAVRMIAQSGADAVLVQDFGVARAVRQIAPGLSLHASTQMAAHNRAGVEFLARQGFSRVVLAREMSLEEIRSCAGLGVEIEVFVHGALCVACSGQCLFSSMVGGRSGNRGRCAQPCRLRYRMEDREGYLLSTRDLCALEQLDALREAGVDSLKIEGRLKRPEYVALVTSAYRAALDHPEAPRNVESLRQIFSRGGFTRGYLPGVEDDELMYTERPNHLGVEVGVALRDGQIRLTADVDAADALALRSGQASHDRAFTGRGESIREDRPVKLSGRAGENVSYAACKGDRLIRLTSEAQMKAARASWEGEHRLAPVDGVLTLKLGDPASFEVSDGTHQACAQGEVVQAARSRCADVSRLEAQLRKTGGTPYRMERIRMDVEEGAFCPVSTLNALRRDALEALSRMRLPEAGPLYPMEVPAKVGAENPDAPRILIQSGDAHLLCRAVELGADGVIFAPEDLRPDALERAAQALPERFRLALPMVLPQGALLQIHAWAHAHRERLERVYLSNVGQFALSWPAECAADFSLNIANRLATAQLMEWGCRSYTPSVELTAGQIEALGGRRELIIHGRLPLMQLRHCPYRATHGLHGPHAACTRCDACSPEAQVNAKFLVDRMGAKFPLRRQVSEEGCVVRLMNSAPLMTLRRIGRLPGAEAWRLLIDDFEELPDALRLYRAAARGENFESDPAWQRYAAGNTTTGHYFRGVE